MIIGNILDLDAVREAVQGCFAVYNFAGIADLTAARDLPMETAQVNIIGNLNLLEAARLAGVKRFVFASTVYVYSDAGSFYRVSKQACEKYVEAYHDRFGLEYSILRYGSLYGRRTDSTNAIHGFIKQALENRKIVYEGKSDAWREYIHVEDAARLSVEILKPELANRHLILTGPERMTVENLMKMIAEIVPGQVEIEFRPNPKDDSHYVMTPYSFNPKIGHKLILNDHVDIGQGLLDCMSEIFANERTKEDFDDGLLIKEREN
jgi:UDP-glucose 4-epimerase